MNKNNKLITILLSTAVFIMLTAVFTRTFIRAGSVYYYYFHIDGELRDVIVNVEDESVVKYTGRSDVRSREMLVFEAQSPGETDISIYVTTEENPDELFPLSSAPLHLTVTKYNFIYTDSFGFSTFGVIARYFCEIFFVAAVLFLFFYQRKYNESPYSHKAILYQGLGLFCLLTSIMFLYFIGSSSLNPENYDATSLFMFVSSMHSILILYTMPFIVLFALFMMISNISLIRHEGYRISNLLGFLISFMLGAGAIGCFVIDNLIQVGIGERVSEIIPATTVVFINSAFLYFECYLIATFYNMFKTVHKKPEYDADYIIILGCQIRKDGTLKPLLRGRVDEAVKFYRDQAKANDKRAVFIPSGGQGSDEIMSEGEAMANYLREQGIPDAYIMPETKSRTTYENMMFSKELIEKDAGSRPVKTVFATTNYHVFRAGVFSLQAGLKATGIGAKTKWYFWPNAMIRELVALLTSSYKLQIIAVILLLIESFAIANIGLVLRFLIT